jgi:hypothetical protein
MADDEDGAWLQFPYCEEFGIDKPFWIHTTRNVDFVRFKTPIGKWVYLSGSLIGELESPLFVQFSIDGVTFYRHRAMALSAGIATIEQYRDPALVIMHKKRREEGVIPDDRPENIEVGTRSDNNLDAGNKDYAPRADGKPVLLTNKVHGYTKTLPSVTAASKFLGVNPGSLSSYLNGGKVKSVPNGKGAEWEVSRGVVASFGCADAVRIPGALDDDDRRLSPTLAPNPLLRSVGSGKYVFSKNAMEDKGKVPIMVNGVRMPLARLVFATFKRIELDAKIDTLPPGSTVDDINFYHADGDKRNNSLDNIMALTREDINRMRSYKVDWPVGDDVRTFASSEEAARAVCEETGDKFGRGNITQVCMGERSNVRGHVFRYHDNMDKQRAENAKSERKRKREARLIC